MLTASIEDQQTNGDRRHRTVVTDAAGNRLLIGPWYPTPEWPYSEFTSIMSNAIDNQINLAGCVVNTHVERLANGRWTGCIRHLTTPILRTPEQPTEGQAKVLLDHVLSLMREGRITVAGATPNGRPTQQQLRVPE